MTGCNNLVCRKLFLSTSCLTALLKKILCDEICHIEGRIIPVKIFYYLHAVNRYIWGDSMYAPIKRFSYLQSCTTVRVYSTCYNELFCMHRLCIYYAEDYGKNIYYLFHSSQWFDFMHSTNLERYKNTHLSG